MTEDDAAAVPVPATVLAVVGATPRSATAIGNVLCSGIRAHASGSAGAWDHVSASHGRPALTGGSPIHRAAKPATAEAHASPAVAMRSL
jgi:hypothetical protein